MSKSEFALHIGVVPSRVTRMIADGLIGPDALVGTGRLARIDVDKAKAQIAARRHVGQALGNGLLTRLEGAETPPPGDPLKPDDTAALIQLERLEQERRKNRVAAIDEARSLGQLVPVEDMQREIGKATQAMLNVFTGMAPDIANEIAARFAIPQRDVLHLVRQVMNRKREAAAGQARSGATTMPESKEAELAVA